MADITQEDVDKALAEFKGKGGEVRELEYQTVIRKTAKTFFKHEYGKKKGGLMAGDATHLHMFGPPIAGVKKRHWWEAHNKKLKKKSELEAAEQHYQESNAKRKDRP